MFTVGIGRLFGRMLGRAPKQNMDSTTVTVTDTTHLADQPKSAPWGSQVRRGTKSVAGAFGKPKGGRMERKLLRLRKLGLA